MRFVASVAAVAWLLTAMAATPRAAPSTSPAGSGQGQRRDYDATNQSWNGLSTFIQLARGAGFRVDTPAAVDWDDLGPDDVLVLLYPTQSIDPTHVREFIANGGKLVVGDDFGSGGGIATRLGFLREDALGVRADFHDDLPFAPIARPLLPDHPLARDVAELVTNHPTVFSEVEGGDAVFGFSPGDAIVVARNTASGRFVLLSDPSVLINGMLRFPGNVQFALNLLRYFAPDGNRRGRLVVMTGDLSLTGVPSRDLTGDSLAGSVSSSARDLNNFFEELNDWYLNASASRVLGVALGVLVGLLALAAIPLRRRGAPLDGSWLRAAPRTADGVPPAPARAHALIEHFDDEGYRGSYLVPASLLRDAIDTRITERTGIANPLAALTRDALLAQVEAHAGTRARAALEPICRTLQSLPGRLTDSRAGSGRALSRRELRRLQAGAVALERALSNEDGEGDDDGGPPKREPAGNSSPRPPAGDASSRKSG